ncbi:unnamed protein product [marine sediment metagenome]|uniref:Uncharacterized protein n=1 Tax=marine sediment metagenome TaxID=412755 RepID=X1C830_9ZZZZ
MNKTEIQKEISSWCKRSAEEYDERAIFVFEDISKESFSFMYGGYLYTILCYNSIPTFDKIFDNTGWE